MKLSLKQTLGLLIISLNFIGPRAWSLSCAEPQAKQMIQSGEVIFWGRVLKSGRSSNAGFYAHKVKVIESLRGEVKGTVDVQSSGIWGPHYPASKKKLLFVLPKTLEIPLCGLAWGRESLPADQELKAWLNEAPQ
jgi:hypothetical protein